MNESSFGFEQVANKERELTLEQAEALMKRRIIEGIERNKGPLYAAFAVMLNEQNVPLLFERKRKDRPHPGTYSIVGGEIDLRNLNGNPKSNISTKLEENGLENPTTAVIRELKEELYSHLQLSDEQLEECFDPKRFAVVYDAIHNAYNFLFTVRQLDSISFQIEEAAVGEMKALSEIDPAKINPLSRFALRLTGNKDMPNEGIVSGPIKHIVLPENVFQYLGQVGGKDPNDPPNLTFGEELHEPAYLISY